MRRLRRIKILATLGPASSDSAMIRRLFEAGADVFRINMSHTPHDTMRELVKTIRNVESSYGRPIGILVDLQGPKLRLGSFANGPVQLNHGASFVLDSNKEPGDAERVYLPHPEILAALKVGDALLLDDGKVRLICEETEGNRAVTAIGSVADHPYPSLTKNYHHEVELVAALKSGGTNIPADKALDHVYGYALGLDMTRRDLQNGMAAEKKPWEIGKSFDHAAVIGPIHPASKTGHFDKGAISLAVNGTIRQNSDVSKMIWSVAEQIAKLSEAFELKAGDIIYSGTPENVGPVVKGDVLLAKLDGLPDLSIKIV
ncbi:pyruvate kinase [Rhodopseudomonas sp. B29]|uniref:pyruvate kinase n=1 Tax=Rhodopseudomonas sp. B29 TaxID=95607 RepID=UPI000349D582|nr:pyruvate kinase [Rhodopseudomonas sp. B29]